MAENGGPRRAPTLLRLALLFLLGGGGLLEVGADVGVGLLGRLHALDPVPHKLRAAVRVTESESPNPSHRIRVTESESPNPRHRIRVTEYQSPNSSRLIRVTIGERTRMATVCFHPSRVIWVVCSGRGKILVRPSRLSESPQSRRPTDRNRANAPGPRPRARPARLHLCRGTVARGGEGGASRALSGAEGEGGCLQEAVDALGHGGLQVPWGVGK